MIRQGLSLIPHPDFPPQAVESVEVWVRQDAAGTIELDYVVTGGELALPAWEPGLRTDGLWNTTCFELFVKRPGENGYLEFNFSPSGKWAVYSFDRYRAQMRAQEEAEDPEIRAYGENASFQLFAEPWPPSILDGYAMANLTAVIEEADGTKSYWALAHPGEKPDFHHPDGFVLDLNAPV